MIKNDQTKTLEEQIAEQEAKLAELKAEQTKLAEAEKEAAKATKKEDAEIVKSAIVARIEQETATRKAKREAYRVYLEACDAAEALLTEAKHNETEKLKDFCAKYGAFHDTITIGDITYVCNYDAVSHVDPLRKILDFWYR